MNESRATRHQREARLARTAATVCGVASLGVLALTPLGPSLARWAEVPFTSWPAPAGRLASLLAFIVVVTAGCELVLLALALLTRPSRESRRSIGEIVRGHVLAASLVVAATACVGSAVQISIWLSPALWWMLAAALAAGAMAAALHVAPGLLARASGAVPVHRPSLVEHLGTLARGVRVEILSIDEVPAQASVTSTALVAGAGARRRVFISSELTRHWSDGEIGVVVAHELAHHVHHDLWRTLAVDAGLLAVGFGAAHAMGLSAGGALEGLPRIALAAALVFLAATPARHALSRRQEQKADEFALRLTGGVEEFRAAIRRLAAQHLAEERPSRWTRWFYHRHPTVGERLQFAEDFAREATSAPRSGGRAFPSGSVRQPRANSGSRIRPPEPRGN